MAAGYGDPLFSGGGRKRRAQWGMPQDYFGERTAQTYQAKWPGLFDPAVIDPAVSFLADLAGSGAALELGIGTGRIALPLTRRGVRVHDGVAGRDEPARALGRLAPRALHGRQHEPHFGVAERQLRHPAAHGATTRHCAECSKWWYGAIK